MKTKYHFFLIFSTRSFSSFVVNFVSQNRKVICLIIKRLSFYQLRNLFFERCHVALQPIIIQVYIVVPALSVKRWNLHIRKISVMGLNDIFSYIISQRHDYRAVAVLWKDICDNKLNNQKSPINLEFTNQKI